jgi:hypothetical protein
MAGSSRIDDHVAALGHRLRGPRRLKRDLLAEARDSLVDAAEALEAGGLDRDEAERVAVAEFGEVAEIVPGYQAELAACQGRRTAALLFVSVPATTLMWSELWHFYPWSPASLTEAPSWFLPLARLIDWLQILTGIAGALALLALGRFSRRVGDPCRLTRRLGILVLVQIPVIGLATSVLSLAASPSLATFEDYLPGQVVSLISTLLCVWQLSSALRCLYATSYARERLAAPERVTA